MIPPEMAKRFQLLVEAARVGKLALTECTAVVTGAPRYVLAVVEMNEEAQKYTMAPFGHLVEGNPLDHYVPPQTPEQSDSLIAVVQDPQLDKVVSALVGANGRPLN